MANSTNPETLLFANELESWRVSHGLTIAELSNILGISRQHMGDVLACRKSFSQETALRAIQLLNKYEGNKMDNQNPPEELEQINAAVVARYAKNNSGTRIKYFQSGLGNELVTNDGFLPREGATEDDLSDTINQLIANGRYDQVRALLDQLQGANIRHSSAPRASVNANGTTTRDAVRVTDNSGRGTTVNGQKFNTSSPAFKAQIEAIKEKGAEFSEKAVLESYEVQVPQVKLKNSKRINFDRVDMETVNESYSNHTLEQADPTAKKIKNLAARLAKMNA